MPKTAKPLAAYQVKKLTKPGLHAVGGVAGLGLRINATGGRSWVLRIVVGDRRREVGLGGYPTVSLEQARERAQAMRDEAWQGVDPVEAKRERDAELRAAQAKVITFDEAAKLCHAAKRDQFRNRKHRQDWISSLDRYASPVIGNLPVASIQMPHVIAVLEPIWKEKTETATRVRQRIEAVLSWATVSQYREGDNPARWKGNLEHALPKPSKVRKKTHFRALPWEDVGAFMAALRKRQGMSTRALEFAILTAARSLEVRGATWAEIDLDAGVWTIPAERMKADKEHRVPLSKQALRLLRDLPRLVESEYVFPASRGGKLSDMALSSVTRRMKVDAVPHGFRSSFKDWCRSQTAYADEVSELALAHVSSDATRAAYARDELLPKRKRLMQDWADYLDRPEQGGDVVPLRKRK
jgi:integrase